MIKPKVLIIDDEEDILINLEAALEADGYEIFIARNGTVGLELAYKKLPDLIILDIMMPDIDGYEVLRRLKEHEELKHIGVIFASALKKTRNKVEGLDMGADDYVTKPYHMTELLAKIRALFRIQSYQRQLEKFVDFAHSVNKLDYKAIGEAVVEHFNEVVRADRFSLFVLEDSAWRLRLLAHNHPDKKMDNISFSPDDSPLMSEALNTGTMQFLTDFQSSRYGSGAGDKPVANKGKYADGFALCLPLSIGEEVLGVLNLNGNSKGFFDKSDFYYAQLAAEMIASSLNNARRLEEQKRLATTDSLTKLLNRRRFQEILAYEFERARRYKIRLSMVMIDIDHFKNVNDTYGHAAGDIVLIELAVRIKKHLRSVDTFCRYGGEEFAILLPETDAVASRPVVERLREEIAGTPFITDKGPLDVTISLGVCDTMCEGVNQGEELVKKADEALYISKNTGRNRVSIYSNDQALK